MKKILSLVLVLTLTFVCSAFVEPAEAVTVSTTTISSYESPVLQDITYLEEEVRFILDASGKPVGVLDEHEATYRRNVGMVTYSGNTVKSAMANGKVVRSKNVATVTLDEQNNLLGGSTVVKGTLKVLDDRVGQRTAAVLIDNTVVAHPNGDGTYTAYHRFIQSDSAGEKVAELRLPSGNYVSIWLTDWNKNGTVDENGDGILDEFALRAGTAPNKSNGGSSNNGGNNDGDNGGDNGGGGNTSVQPNPENDDVILPPSIGGGNNNGGGNSSGGSTNSPAPNPENDNVTLPWS